MTSLIGEPFGSGFPAESTMWLPNRNPFTVDPADASATAVASGQGALAVQVVPVPPGDAKSVCPPADEPALYSPPFREQKKARLVERQAGLAGREAGDWLPVVVSAKDFRGLILRPGVLCGSQRFRVRQPCSVDRVRRPYARVMPDYEVALILPDNNAVNPTGWWDPYVSGSTLSWATR